MPSERITFRSPPASPVKLGGAAAMIALLHDLMDRVGEVVGGAQAQSQSAGGQTQSQSQGEAVKAPAAGVAAPASKLTTERAKPPVTG